MLLALLLSVGMPLSMRSRLCFLPIKLLLELYCPGDRLPLSSGSSTDELLLLREEITLVSKLLF